MVAEAADRLSLIFSGTLAGGVLLMVLAMLLQERVDRPSPAPEVPPSAVPAAARADMPAAIRLPPPPLPPRAPVGGPAAASPPPSPLPPARVVEPLKAGPPVATAAPGRPIAPPRPEPVAERAPPAEASTPPWPLIDAARYRKAGGALLRLLEHGNGPAIEIGWPRSASDRLALYRLLTRCYGMRAAVLGAQSRLFAGDDPAGQPLDIDRDRVSGFLRSPRGEEIPEESRAFSRIARHHGLIGWRPVRVFPRDVDAALLGGLARLLGPRYRSARSITAAYVLGPPGLNLDRFRIDGAPVAGGIALAPHRAGCG